MDQPDTAGRFEIILEWLLRIQARNPELMKFGLIHICFHDQAALGSAYGAPVAAGLLRDLLENLQKAFRKTDLVIRQGTDFWVLVPDTTPETVIEKVRHLVDIASENGLAIVDRDVAVFSMPNPELAQQLAGFSSVQAFLNYLKRNRHVACEWQHASAS